MAHPRLLIALSLLWGCEPSEVVGYSEFDPDAPLPALYEVKEWTFEYHEPLVNPFTHYIQVDVWRENEDDNEPYHIEGFYAGLDGNRDPIWKARFMPTKPGRWHYRWTVGDESGGDVLDVQARRDPLNHGHVHVENAPRPVLRHDDGTVHYWFGGKAFTARNYGQPAKHGQQNLTEQSGHDTYYTDEEFKDYLDLMQETGHNGTRLKIALYPLEDDGLTWDLVWIDRAERWIRWMQARHIYCQITFFDPASRAKMKWFESSNDPDDHPLNAWQDEGEEAKRNYIRYIVARFAAYSNVYWELVERVDAFGPEADNSFVDLANRNYVSWLRSYDPYDLPIGASAEATPGRIRQIDIEFSRDRNTLLASYSDRAIVLNEVGDHCGGDPAQDDTTIRDENNRQCYRAALWRAFVSGAFGANEASWLDLTQTLDAAVQNVMRDQARLREIVEGLPVGLEELTFAEGFVESTSPRVGTRAKDGELYVAYFPAVYPAGAINVRLPAGAYTACWLNPEAPDPPDTNPRAGAIPNPPGPLLTEGAPSNVTVETDSASVSLGRPSFNGDLVLLVERSDGTSDRSCLAVGSASNPG